MRCACTPWRRFLLMALGVLAIVLAARVMEGGRTAPADARPSAVSDAGSDSGTASSAPSADW